MDFIKVKLKDVQANPFRQIDSYKLQPKRISALVDSINQTGFWNNIVGRVVDGEFQIAYGHHRMEAATQALGKNHVHTFPVVEIADYQMLQMMGAENSEDWGNTTEHDNLTVAQARDMLDEWFDSVKVVGDNGKLDGGATMERLHNSADVHGIGYDQAIEWFGGPNGDDRKATSNLAKMVKHSAGRGVIAAFMGMKVKSVEYALEIIGMSPKEVTEAKAEAKAATAETKRLEKELKEARKTEDKKKRAHREKAIQADLDKAEEDEQNALGDLEEDGFVDRKAVELFEKPIHAKAFRKAAVKATRRGHLKVSDQKKLAQSILSELGESGLSARAIEEKVNSQIRKLKGAMPPQLADYAEHLNNVRRYGSSLTSSLQSLRRVIKEHKIESISGDEVDGMHKELRGVLQSIGGYWGQQGRYMPSMSWELYEDGKISYSVSSVSHSPMWTEDAIEETYGLILSEYEVIS